MTTEIEDLWEKAKSSEHQKDLNNKLLNQAHKICPFCGSDTTEDICNECGRSDCCD